MQLIPGHEAIGTVVDFGSNVKDFEKGDRCAADVGITVSSVFDLNEIFFLNSCVVR